MPRLNDYNISMQHIYCNIVGSLIASPSQQSQHVDRVYCNVVGHNMLHAFGHPVVTRCGMLGITNQTSVHALVQPCCINLAKQVQHHATSTMLHEKFDHFQT